MGLKDANKLKIQRIVTTARKELKGKYISIQLLQRNYRLTYALANTVFNILSENQQKKRFNFEALVEYMEQNKLDDLDIQYKLRNEFNLRVREQTIIKWRSGTRPNAEALFALAEIIGVPAKNLICF